MSVGNLDVRLRLVDGAVLFLRVAQITGAMLERNWLVTTGVTRIK
jgi:hypothetical protein